MKKHIAIVFSIFLSLSAYAQFRDGYAELNDSETVGTLKSHVSFISSAAMEGRKAGSEGEKECAKYVWNTLKDYGVDMLSDEDGDLFGIKTESGDTLNSRNIMGFVQGYDPQLRDQYIVIGARLDNLGTNVLTVDGQRVEQIYYGANGNASGLALMMELAKMVSTNNIMFRRSILFVAFGASRNSFAGSWYFLNRSFGDVDKIAAMVNLDMLGMPDGFKAYTASNQDMNMLLSSMSSQLLPVMPEIAATEPYPSDHRNFYASEIPSVYLTTGFYAEHDSYRDNASILDYEAMEVELEYIYALTKTLANESVLPTFRGNEFSQKETDSRAYSYHDCDTKPAFMGHSNPSWFMTKWVYQYLRYPQEAVRSGIQGRVHVTFTIEKDGKVSDVLVQKGVDPLLDEEAVRVIKASPKWKAAKKNGQTVRSYITIPVDFKLEKSSSKSRMGIKK